RVAYRADVCLSSTLWWLDRGGRMKVEGDIRIGEGAAYATKATAPITKAPWPLLISMAVSAISTFAALGFSEVLADIGIIPSMLEPLVMIVAGGGAIIFSLRVCQAVQVRNFRRSLHARGVSDPLWTAFEVTDQGLICRSDAMEYRADWRAVTDLLKVGPYWVALAQAQPLMLPRRFFADSAAETAFVSAVFERLAPEAQARSRDAHHFVGAGRGR
ncbi:hypothetical protein WDZ92_45425, partial [Nostoc sp. NIES-2111]